LGILDWILGKEREEEKKPEEKPAKKQFKKIPSIPLTDISGVGKTTEEQLINAGISDARDLAEADLDKLSTKLNYSKTRLKRWQAQSRRLVK
jgi:predicted flap endonuclease-1-like 5' DNA nuclease